MHHHHARTHWPHVHPRDVVVAAAGQLLRRDNCTSDSSSPACEKPTNPDLTLPIALGAAIPIGLALIVLLYLHRRHTLKLRREDAMDKTKSMDFGMDFGPASKNAKKTNLPEGEKGESRSRHQLSLDMGMDSPYLIPGAIHDSRESLTSLARTMTGHSPSERRRSIADTMPRSQRSRTRDSYYAPSSLRLDDSPDGSESMHAELLGSAQKMPTSTPPPPRGASLAKDQKEPPVPRINVPTGPDARSSSATGLPSSPRDANHAPQKSEESNIAVGIATVEIEEPPKSPGYSSGIPSILQVGQPSPTFQNSLDFGEGGMPQFRLSSASVESGQAESVHEEPAEKVETARKSLMPGAFDNRRLSMGFRPLPPEGNADENAEERAMRIRSFYKEYFSVDDANAAAAGGIPPPMPHGSHDDFSAEYYNDGAIFDPDTGRFIIPGAKPFAEPPMRRAMTPPPRMPPRFGGPGARAPSAGSGRFMPPGPRAFSSAGARMPMPKRPIAPPKPLNLLPTPAKLSEDAFASPTLFAPAIRVNRDGTDTSSLRGGQRPYSPMVSPHVPLASAFNELAPLPTPHALRNSSTFTALDFAPPKPSYAQEDNGSDAGSIRSNQSGRSAMQVHNIRNGAYRVSRIPQNVVPLKDDMANELKPTWGMRPGAN